MYLFMFCLLAIATYVKTFDGDFEQSDLVGSTLIVVTVVVFMLLSMLLSI